MAKDEGRKLVPHDALEGFEGSLDGLRVGEELLESPAVGREVEGNRNALAVALVGGLAAFAVPGEGLPDTLDEEGEAYSLVSGSGDTISVWSDFQNAQDGQAPDMEVVLPVPNGSFIQDVVVTKGDKIVAVTTNANNEAYLFVIDESGTIDTLDLEGGAYGAKLEMAPDGNGFLLRGETIENFNPNDPEGTLEEVLAAPGQTFTSAESFTDGEGKPNVLAVGQTPGSDADYLYHICEQDGEDVVTSYSFGTGSWESPYGPRITDVELSDSKLVFSDPGGTVVSVDFDESDISSLGPSLEAPTTIMGSVDIESAIKYAGHNSTAGYYTVMEGDGTVHSFGKDVSARDTLNVGDDILEVAPVGGDTYLVRTGEGIVEVNGATQEIIRTVEGVGGSVNAVVTGDPEVAALLYAPVFNGVHVAASDAFTIDESEEPDTVSATLDLEAMIESGEPAEFSSLTVDATTFEHTIIINFGFDDIVLTGFGTAIKVTVSIVDGRVKLTAKVLKDGRLGNSSASLNGGDPIHEHPNSSAGETEEQTIDLGPVESFTGDDDDTGGQTDDDDAGQLDDDDADEVPGGCADADCDAAGAGSSDDAPFVAGGILGGGILWARRKRGRKAA